MKYWVVVAISCLVACGDNIKEASTDGGIDSGQIDGGGIDSGSGSGSAVPTLTAEDQSIVVAKNGTKSFAVMGTSSDASDTLAFAIGTAPANGSATISGATVTYTPTADFAGSDTFSFTVSDAAGGSATGTISVTVDEAIYVDAAAGNDLNDGLSPATAVQTIATGLTTATADGFDLVVLAAGTYDERLAISSSVTIQGPSVMDAGSDTAVIQPSTWDAGSATVITVSGSGTTFELDSVEVDGSQFLGSASAYDGIALGSGTSTTFTDVHLHSLRPSDALFGAQGIGTIHALQANLDVESSLFDEFSKSAIRFEGTTDGSGPVTLTVNNSHFIGTNPVALGTYQGQNVIEPFYATTATITNNVIEQIGPSGSDTVDYFGAHVAPDGTIGFAILPVGDGTNEPALAITGNTFEQDQGIYTNYFIGAAAGESAAFLANNTIAGRGLVIDEADYGVEIDGIIDGDDDFLVYALATDDISAVALLPGDYRPDTAVPDLADAATVNVTTGSATVYLPANTALPVNLAAGPNVTFVLGSLACYGNSQAAAGDTATVSGVVDSVGLASTGGTPTFDLPLSGFTGEVDICLDTGSDDLCDGSAFLGSAMADADGNYSVGPIALSGSAASMFLDIPATDSGGTELGAPAATEHVLAFTGEPIVADSSSPMAFVQLAVTPGVLCPSMDSGSGMLAIEALDCSGNVLADTDHIAVDVQQSGSDLGSGALLTTVLDPSVYAVPSELQSVFIVCGVPVGPATVNVTYTGSGTAGGSLTFLPAQVLSAGSAITEVSVRPGY